MSEKRIDQTNTRLGLPLEELQHAFGSRLEQNAPLARFTSARIGGPADVLLVVNNVAELAEATQTLWDLDLTFVVIGGGSNVLVSDAGVRGVVILNRAREIHFDEQADPPSVWAESGANLGVIARQASGRGLSDLEWAVGIPGTVGGAVVGNAGAHDGDLAGNLIVAEILHQKGMKKPAGYESTGYSRENWPVEKFNFSYRNSYLKSRPGQAVVLSALLRLSRSAPERMVEIQARLETFNEHRRRTQPPGASMGSMFKNPPGDYAGRLIEAAGLKGVRIGDAEISALHANFFINHGRARAKDVQALMDLARRTVAQKFSVKLEPEIEQIGEW